MARFTLPRDIYHGKGSLEALKTFEGKRAMICVGGGSMKRFGFLDRAESYLKEAGMEVEIFEGIEPDPSVETVMRGAEAMSKFNPDWIVAIGGGSPIDAAKAMWIKYEYPDCTFEDMCKVFGLPQLRKKAHFCAVSSTSGTATDNDDMNKRHAMHDAQCLAGMAFSNALLGIVHSMAHKTGAAFADYGAHIIHGAANAMYLPKVIAFNAKNETAKKRYGVIADYMHLGGSTDSEKVGRLIKYIRNMNDDLNIPHGIKHYGADSYPTEQGFVPEKVFLERLPKIAELAIGDACTGSNPRIPTQKEMEDWRSLLDVLGRFFDVAD